MTKTKVAPFCLGHDVGLHVHTYIHTLDTFVYYAVLLGAALSVALHSSVRSLAVFELLSDDS